MTQYINLTTTPVEMPKGENGTYITVEQGANPRYAIGATSPDPASGYHVLQEASLYAESRITIWMWLAEGALPTAVTVSPLD